jgi:hypothetical protein
MRGRRRRITLLQGGLSRNRVAHRAVDRALVNRLHRPTLPADDRLGVVGEGAVHDDGGPHERLGVVGEQALHGVDREFVWKTG